ncbi:YybH family protein [Gemmata sp.]|uniref:YybH family protein n=1 Tax=Gemmata sp. TaxID=1914242 RepID=UPI003F721A40
MNRSTILTAAAVATAALAVAYRGPAQSPPPAVALPAAQVVAAAAPDDADRVAVVKSARDFEAAFNTGDAKAVAALWTANGESREATGETFRGRLAIEKAYAEFFKANAGARVEVLVKSVRFPAKDVAVEEGLVRQTRGPKDLPGTTSYVTVHAREGGQWKIALSSEAGVGNDRLEDLDWLLGNWTARVKDDAVTFTFARDPKKPNLTATFTRTPAGKEPVTGTVRIAADPETGRIRSWAFEDDGAHSQGLWFCDGKSWVIDAHGVLADGTPTAERIILQRVAPDAITWRVVDRVLGDARVKDAPPVRLTRAAAK